MSKSMNNQIKIARLRRRTVLRLAGPDVFEFLQGIISQDVTLAKNGQPLFTAFLTPQGKYQFDFFVVPEGDRLLIDCAVDEADELAKRLSFYRMRARVALEDTREAYAVYALWDGETDMPNSFTDCRLNALGRRLLIPIKAAGSIEETADEADYRQHRYQLGVPEGSHEIDVGHSNLMEANFDKLNAISWSKGCYMGQELTARIYHRGLVKKRYLPFSYDGLTPEKHERVLDGGFEVGEIKALEGLYGIGLFNLERVRPFVMGERMLVPDGMNLNITLPPYLDKSIFNRKPDTN